MCFRNYFCSLRISYPVLILYPSRMAAKVAMSATIAMEMKTHKRYCIVCGRAYHTTRYMNRFCSRNCLEKYKKYRYQVPTERQANGEEYLSAKIYNKICTVCGKSYTASLSIQIYCCHGCAKLSRKYSAGSPHDIEINTPKPEYRLDSSKVMYNLTCAHCGKVFQSSKVTTQYCSSECAKKERIQTEHDKNRLITTIPS